MAFKLFIIVALIAASTKADFPFPNMFPTFQMPAMPPIPPMPPMPPMPTFQMPVFPKIEFPKIEIPKMPSLAELEEKSKTDPNTNFNSVSVVSQSSTTTDENGNIIKKGGTAVRSSNNGEVHEVEFGNDPPVIKKASSTKTPKDNSKEQASNTIPKKAYVKKYKSAKVKPSKIEKPIEEVINPNGLLNQNTISSFVTTNNNGVGAFQSVFSNGGGGFQSTFTSTGGNGFASSLSSSSSSFSDINGVKSGGGISSTHYNINGKSGGETIVYSTR